MNKFLIICLILLISYSNTADCSSKTTQALCTAESDCEWTAGSCSGDTTCTGKTTQSDCASTKYGDTTSSGYECTFTAGNPSATPATSATCTGGTACEAVASPTEATCVAASTKKTCTWTAGSCKSKSASNTTPTSTSNTTSNSNSDSSSNKLKSSFLVSLAFLLL